MLTVNSQMSDKASEFLNDRDFSDVKVIIFNNDKLKIAGRIRKITLFWKDVIESLVEELDVMPDFIIELQKELVGTEFEEIILYHEICHLERKENGSVGIRKHDVEEFSDVIEKYGLYHKELKKFINAATKSKAKTKKDKEPDKEEGKIL